MFMKCHVCRKEITRKNDVNFLAFLGVVPHAFCNQCYAKKERGFMRHMLYTPKQPINGIIYLVGAIFFTLILGIIMIVLGFSNESLLMKVVAILIMALMIAWTWILRGLVYSKIGLLK